MDEPNIHTVYSARKNYVFIVQRARAERVSYFHVHVWKASDSVQPGSRKHHCFIFLVHQ